MTLPIPPLNHHGLLPPGIHNCCLNDVTAWFAGDVRRSHIWGGLMQVLPLVRGPFAAHGVVPSTLVLGGSFFSDKPDPADIEATVILEATHPAALKGDFTTLYYQYHDQWHGNHLVDFYPTLPGQNNFASFFQYVGVKTATLKGLQPKDLRGVVGVKTW